MGGKFVWPTLEECKTYRVKCRELVNEIIDRISPVFNSKKFDLSG